MRNVSAADAAVMIACLAMCAGMVYFGRTDMATAGAVLTAMWAFFNGRGGDGGVAT